MALGVVLVLAFIPVIFIVTRYLVEPVKQLILQNNKIRDRKFEDVQKIEAAKGFKTHMLPHPYNISFITDPKAHMLFEPMKLLKP